ncbi:hypothetical protein KBI33_01485 [Candidatus Shapirobacteria bacterium]|nr:hypothetical protein [Candidatus Shapirobacteria bacterium]
MKEINQEKKPKRAEKKNLLLGGLFLALLVVLFLNWWLRKNSRFGPQAQTSFYWQPEEIVAEAGKTVPVMLMVDSGQNILAGIEIGLEFEDKFLEIISILPGDFFTPATVAEQRIDNAEGKAFFTFLCSPQKPRQGKGNLVLINFLVKEKGHKGETLVNFSAQTQAAAIGEEKNVVKSARPLKIKIEEKAE